MPLILTKKINYDLSLNVWRLDETLEDLNAQVILDVEEENYLNSFGNVTRKKQWLGYRILLQHLLEGKRIKICYDQFGKPFIPGSECHLSVSHSVDYVAAIINRKGHIGIDIERIRERIERVKDRFLSEEELKNIGAEQRLEKLHICWGAKESLYKWYGKPDVDFKADMMLEQFHYLCIGKGMFRATMNLPEGIGYFTIHYQKIGDYMLVWAVPSSQFAVPGKE